MKSRAVAFVAYGQLFLALFLALCVALHPGFVLKSDEGGMSNYGIHLKTATAYTMSLGLPALFSMQAARLLGGDATLARKFGTVLRTYGWLLLLTLLSTYVYSLDTALRDLHIVIGAALAIFQVAASVWMYRLMGGTKWDGILLGMELLGFLLAVFTIVGVLHVLFLSQVLTSGAFALLLIRSAMKVDTGSPVSDFT
jgi:heme/copper-type cytochrome/quinol oxidase subunit 4